MRLHATTRKLRRSTDGRHTWAIGVRAGYWPCLSAPFVQVTLGPRIASVWLSAKEWDGIPPEERPLEHKTGRFEAFDLGRTFDSVPDRAAARIAQREGWLKR